MEALARPDPGDSGVATSYEMVYLYRDHGGKTHQSKAWIGWSQDLQTLEAGDPVPVCFDTLHPRRNVLLLQCRPPAVKG